MIPLTNTTKTVITMATKTAEIKNNASPHKDNVELRERFSFAVNALKSRYPDAECSLRYDGDPWRLLVMARLSAQCTDARVNIVCETLFDRFPDAASMAAGDITDIEDIVRPCGLYHVKARDIKAMSAIIADSHCGRVPDTMDELLSLPGVGRKIANLILGDIYNIPGVVADTHCIRICGRLGAYDEAMKDPARAERIVSAIVEPVEQTDFCHRLVMFGREVCMARSPECGACELSSVCAHAKSQGREK